MLATAREVARLGLHSVKLHNLYVARDTPLAQMYARGEVRLLELTEYAALAADVLELLPPEYVIDRWVPMPLPSFSSPLPGVRTNTLSAVPWRRSCSAVIRGKEGDMRRSVTSPSSQGGNWAAHSHSPPPRCAALSGP